MSDLPRQTVIRPLGLITQPSNYGQYAPGALRKAHNFTLRNPGELVQAPGAQDIVTVGAANNRIEQLIPLDSGHVYSLHRNGTTWSIFENTSAVTLPTPVVSFNLFSSTGRISWARVRERLMLNSLQGYLVGDYMAPINAAQRNPRMAGLPQPNIKTWNPTTTNGAAIPVDVVVGYRAIFRRVFADGYDLKSVPTPTFKYRNTGGGLRNMDVTFSWLATLGIVAGDRIELYRSKGTNTTSADTDPDPSFFRVVSYTLTSGDIAAGFVTITDRQMMFPSGSLTTPGEALYTNPNADTSDYSNDQPPVAKCTASFQGFCFYGNTTERPTIVTSVPGGISTQSVAVASGVPAAHFKAFGIGQKEGAGTITAASATITGIAAADLVGIKQGMRWSGSGTIWPSTATVQTVGGTSIVMSQPAANNGVSFQLSDALEISGFTPSGLSWSTTYRAADLADLFQSIGNATGTGAYELDCTTAIPTAKDVSYCTGVELTFRPARHVTASQLTIRATNGANYSPPLPEYVAAAQAFDQIVTPNLIYWSKEQQPEAVPSVSSLYAGFGELYALRATRDALWAECSDGLFRISGDGGANGQGSFSVNYANSNLILTAPQASCVLSENLYGYYNTGVCMVDSAGNVTNITDQRIGDLLPGTKYQETAGIFMEVNETDEEILLVENNIGTGGDIVYVWNVKQKGWTTIGTNSVPLVDITAMAMQRSPASGEPRTMFASSPLGGASPQYCGWNSTSTYLDAECQYQPLFADDPLSIKQWILVDFLFEQASAGKTFIPVYNNVSYSTAITIQSLDMGGYARAGVPSKVAASQSMSPGVRSLSTSGQGRFQGLAVQFKTLTNMSKKK